MQFFTKEAHRSVRKNRRRLSAVALLLIFLLSVFTCTASADSTDDTSIDSNALVTYGYLQSVLEDLKLELLAELSGGETGSLTVGSAYTDVTYTRGTVILLGSDAEAIFRGGDAVVITVSNGQGAGITDLSAGNECFSGEALTFGHIYYKTERESSAYLLVTGDKAAFTMKGTYETH